MALENIYFLIFGAC